MSDIRRSIRRHHRKRLEKKRKNYWGIASGNTISKIVINTPKPCSCFMCGNPRKYFHELTVQQRRLART